MAFNDTMNRMFSSLTPNEAGWDRALRVVVGLAALSQVSWGARSDWGLLGLIPLLTGIVGTCPLYRLLGLNTCSTDKHH